MSVSFIKKGADSVKLAEQQAAEAKAKKEQQGKLWRFFMAKGEEGVRITFIDGALDENGWLVPARWYEHNLYLNGNWNNYYVCPEKTNPGSGDKCPICETGDQSYLASAFTIIDHRTFQSKDKTKTYSDTKKLLIVKPTTCDLLGKIAQKRQGLAGCTFDVMRIGDKAAAVGSNFDFTEKQDIEVLKKKFVHKYTDPKTNEEKVDLNYFSPANYEEEIVFRTGDELRKLGLGKPESTGVTSPAGVGAPAGATDYSGQL